MQRSESDVFDFVCGAGAVLYMSDLCCVYVFELSVQLVCLAPYDSVIINHSISNKNVRRWKLDFFFLFECLLQL